ncbi:hypothetical protein PC111_g11919 [Phytophthora cactorum]|nr:hypothetical protein PC111_g11919 [Phytophthora cactorum]KAG3011640.1 hypothetical protein PC120_g14301 [Phytophthora cactorum]KAG3077408.1 hypothetical protein PC122_g13178 [Phytophthora cactorum]KAG3156907.1 hypothetical protein C6341_g14922 [Phytophthora cactorum]
MTKRVTRRPQQRQPSRARACVGLDGEGQVHIYRGLFRHKLCKIALHTRYHAHEEQANMLRFERNSASRRRRRSVRLLIAAAVTREAYRV